jgi:hypothetical protein
MKEEALHCTLWRTHFGRSNGPVVIQATGCMIAFTWWDWVKPWKTCQNSQHLHWDFSNKPPKWMSSVLQLYQGGQLNHSWMTSCSFVIAFSRYFSRYQTYWTSLSCTYDKRKVQEISHHKNGLQCSTVLNFLHIFPRNLDVSYKCVPPEYRSGTEIFPSLHFFTNRV